MPVFMLWPPILGQTCRHERSSAALFPSSCYGLLSWVKCSATNAVAQLNSRLHEMPPCLGSNVPPRTQSRSLIPVFMRCPLVLGQTCRHERSSAALFPSSCYGLLSWVKCSATNAVAQLNSRLHVMTSGSKSNSVSPIYTLSPSRAPAASSASSTLRAFSNLANFWSASSCSKFMRATDFSRFSCSTR